ncbi:hypothetical protein BD311DRAFT_608360, partial [Dichomitus squalens]
LVRSGYVNAADSPYNFTVDGDGRLKAADKVPTRSVPITATGPAIPARTILALVPRAPYSKWWGIQ